MSVARLFTIAIGLGGDRGMDYLKAWIPPTEQTFNPVKLSDASVYHLKTLRDDGEYAEAYRFLKSKVESTYNADPRTAIWLETAAQINSNDPFSFKNHFVRKATKLAASYELTDEKFQEASDDLALKVINDVLNNRECLLN